MTALGRAWDRLSVYTPIILMGLLALGTYWLARSTPALLGPGPAAVAPTHEPDYFLHNFSVKNFEPNGRLKSDIQGVEARHYPDTDTMEIDHPRIRSYDLKGSLTTATAKRGISNSDGSQVQLIGDAVVTREATDDKGKPLPKLEIRGEFLQAWMDVERVKSNKPVILKRGEDVFHADSMDYDNLDRVMQLEGRVKGVIQPQGAAAK